MLFLNVLSLKLNIITIVLPTNRRFSCSKTCTNQMSQSCKYLQITNVLACQSGLRANVPTC